MWYALPTYPLCGERVVLPGIESQECAATAAAELLATTPNTRSRFAELSLGRRSL